MLNTILPYVGFTAAGLVLVLLLVERHVRASRARAIVVPIAVGTTTQRLPVIVAAPSNPAAVVPPLPPAAFRRQPVPPQPPRRPPSPSYRPPDRPANPRGEARLITPWGDLTRLPGSGGEPGIVPSTLATPGPMGYLPAR